MRNAWKIVDESLTSLQRVKLEATATVSVAIIQCHTFKFVLLQTNQYMYIIIVGVVMSIRILKFTNNLQLGDTFLSNVCVLLL